MNYFQDITTLPDPEFTETFLMGELFSKLHMALARLSSSNIGISFPQVNKTLGNCLRLHGSNESLTKLNLENWLKSIRDYTEQTKIGPVPGNAQYRIVKRIQTKSNVERLRRRSVEKGWLTEEEAEQKILLTSEKRLNMPFVQLISLSSSQKFRLFIQHGPLQSEPMSGSFNTYGLSSNATIPWF